MQRRIGGYAVTRLIPLLALLAACTPPTAEPALPPPGLWREAALPSGVLAEADIVLQSVAYDRRLLQCPPLVVAAVVLHEVCHLRGSITETEADCCAATLFVSLYGIDNGCTVAQWYENHGRDSIGWMECL